MPLTTLVVIPAFNEEESIGDVVGKILRVGFPVLVVDDGSSDLTAEIALRSGAEIVRLPFNLGVGGALRCGFKWALRHGYNTVVQCDADGQHSPEIIPELVSFAEKNTLHLTIGSRFLGDSAFKSTMVRRLPMRIMAFVVSRSSGNRITDTTSGFRVITGQLLRDFAETLPAHYLGDTFDATMNAARAGYRIDELSVSMNRRQFGTSTASTLKSVLYIFRSFFAITLGERTRKTPSSK